MKNILLCPPTYYEIEYEINPWMDIKNKIDKKKVTEEYAALKKVYEDIGCKVYELAPDKNLPDMVYCTNTGHFENGIFIKANFRYPQRKKESDHAQKFFEKTFNAKTVTLPQNVYFEGHGDLLPAGDFYYMGWGRRSSFEAVSHLEAILGKPIYQLETQDAYFYHLDMCLAPLKDGAVLINPKSFKPQGLKKIYQIAKKVIEVDEKDANAMVCNLVAIGDHIIMGKGGSEKVKKQLKDLKYTIHEVEMGEYVKGGGSVFCVTFQF